MISLKSFKNVDELVDSLSEYLITSLKEKNRVLWLLSGGSNIKIEAKIMTKIPDNLTNKLIISLFDERYGEYNHVDSNFHQIKSANFNFKNSTVIEVIENQPESIDSMTQDYRQKIDSILTDENTFSIGQLGLGYDGHIAGILPDSPILDSVQTVDSYESNPYDRISFTPVGLKHLDQIFVVVTDLQKNNIVNQIFIDDKTDEKKIPAKLLHRYNSVNIYNIKDKG